MSLKTIEKKSRKPGAGISKPDAEVLNVSSNGLWLLAAGREYFLPYARYPWFKNAKVQDLYQVRFLHGYHLYWPMLDVDLEITSLMKEENYPLVYHP